MFFIFLYQKYIYKVDPNRVNEYGYSAAMLEEKDKVSYLFLIMFISLSFSLSLSLSLVHLQGGAQNWGKNASKLDKMP